jgi:hypothetical protein
MIEKQVDAGVERDERGKYQHITPHPRMKRPFADFQYPLALDPNQP